MKRGVGFVLLFVLLILYSFSVDASLKNNVTIHNVSVKDSYAPGEALTGIINISLDGFPLNSFVNSNFGGQITLRELLKKNGEQIFCESYNCSGLYKKNLEAGLEEKTINTEEVQDFGFIINGKAPVSLNSLTFQISSDFSMKDEIPLKLNVFENLDWQFSEMSGQFDRFSNPFGCFDSQATTTPLNLSTLKYCQWIKNVPATNKVRLGAFLIGNDPTGLERVSMHLGNEQVGYDTYELICSYDPSSSEPYCDISFNKVLERGDYLVCIDTPSEHSLYRILSESVGEVCGYAGEGTGNFTKDVSIFLKVPKYASSNGLELSTQDLENFEGAANAYLRERYSDTQGNVDCSSDCVLPIKVSGVPQSLTIFNVSIEFSELGGYSAPASTKVYGIEEGEITMDFSGELDLYKTGFKIDGEPGSKTLILSIGEDEIFRKMITIYPAPKINFVYPTYVPAAIPVPLSIIVESSKNITNYEWEFGDGTSEVTKEPTVVHAFQDLNKIYNMMVKVVDVNNKVATKNFTITTGSPREMLNQTLASKLKKTNEISAELNKVPSWYSRLIKTQVNISEYEGELKYLDGKMKTQFEDTAFVEIAQALYSMDLPVEIFNSLSEVLPFLITEDNVDFSLAEEYYAKNFSNVNPETLIAWSIENVQGTIKRDITSALKESGDIEDLVSVINVQVTQNSGNEAALFIDKNFDDLYFSSEVSPMKNGDTTYITLQSGQKSTFSIAYAGSEELDFFVSPSISYLPEDLPIGVCNFNNVCERREKENYKNCRSDCKPLGWTIFWFFIVILVGLIVYTIVQEWYKRNYENKLFPDRNKLLNMLNFIENARARGLLEGNLRQKLAENKWTQEQINYAFKKVNGQQTGLYELIPVEKILSAVRKKKTLKDLKSNPQKVIAAPTPGPLPKLPSRRLLKPVNGMPPKMLPQKSSRPQGRMPLQGKPPIRQNPNFNKPKNFMKKDGTPKGERTLSK